jgi:hypothetical protein
MEVNHKNGIRHDNRLENLEIVTPRENKLHALHVLGHYLGRRRSNKITIDDADAIRALAAQGMQHTAIGRQYGLSQSHVTAIVHGRHWKRVR